MRSGNYHLRAWKRKGLLLIFNANSSAATVTLPSGLWSVCVDGENAGVTELYTAQNSVSVAGISAMMLVQGTLHEHKYTTEVTAPTCSKAGYTTYTCSGCGDVYTADETPTAAHSYDYGKCTACGYEDPNYQAASSISLPGSFNDWNVSNYMTVKNDTIVTYTMELAAGTYEFKIVKDGAWLGNGGTIQDTTTATSAIGWEMSAYDGSNCKLAASGGIYSFSFNTQTNMLIITYQPKLNPTITFGSPTLSLESEVLYNFYFTTTDIEGVEMEDMGLLTWSTRPENGTIDNAEQNFPGAVFNSSGNNYMVRTGGIPAKNMGDKLYVRIYAKLSDGTYVYSALGYYSARVYAEDRIANSSNAKLKSLCVALLNYGAAAQTYFGYRTDDLMNAGIADYQGLVSDYSESMVSALAAVDSTKTEAFTYNGGYKGYYSSASLEGALGCNIYFVPNTTMDGDMTVYFWDKATYDSAAALTAENAAYVKTAAASATAGHYGASFPGIPAKKVDETIFACAVYTSGGVTYCSGVRPISLGQYCADRAANGSEKMQPLAEAIAVYGYYADAYFPD